MVVTEEGTFTLFNPVVKSIIADFGHRGGNGHASQIRARFKCNFADSLHLIGSTTVGNSRGYIHLVSILVRAIGGLNRVGACNVVIDAIRHKVVGTGAESARKAGQES